MTSEYVAHHHCKFCDFPLLRMVHKTCHKDDQGYATWLCQCDNCKSIDIFKIMDYNYLTNEQNVVQEIEA
jgi:hypothetical protein